MKLKQTKILNIGYIVLQDNADNIKDIIIIECPRTEYRERLNNKSILKALIDYCTPKNIIFQALKVSLFIKHHTQVC